MLPGRGGSDPTYPCNRIICTSRPRRMGKPTFSRKEVDVRGRMRHPRPVVIAVALFGAAAALLLAGCSAGTPTARPTGPGSTRAQVTDTARTSAVPVPTNPNGDQPTPFFPVLTPRPGQIPTIPSGRQMVTFHGLAVTVPAAWTMNDTQCGEPIHPTVITDGESDACLLGHLPLVDSVRFFLTPWGVAQTQTEGLNDTVTTVRIPGAAASATERATATQQVSAPGAVPFRIKVSLSAGGVGAMVIGTDEQRARQLVATLRSTAYDTSGCASAVPSTATLPTGGRPAHPGAEQQLIPGHPTAITICRYFAGGFEQAAIIAPAQLARFVATVNAVPRGVSRSKNPAAPYCRPVDHPPARLTVEAKPDQTGWLTDNYLVVVRYGDGTAIPLLSRWAFCGDLGITNGNIAGQRTGSLLTALGVAGDSPAEADVQPK